MKQTKNTTASEEHGHEQYRKLTLDLTGLREAEVRTGTGDDAVDEGGRGVRRRRPKACSVTESGVAFPGGGLEMLAVCRRRAKAGG